MTRLHFLRAMRSSSQRRGTATARGSLWTLQRAYRRGGNLIPTCPEVAAWVATHVFQALIGPRMGPNALQPTGRQPILGAAYTTQRQLNMRNSCGEAGVKYGAA